MSAMSDLGPLLVLAAFAVIAFADVLPLVHLLVAHITHKRSR